METASRQLLAKFKAARALIEQITIANVPTDLAQMCISELSALEIRFALSTGHLFIISASGESGRLSANSEFSRILAAENFSGHVDSLVVRSENALRNVGFPIRGDDAPAKRSGPATRRGVGRGTRKTTVPKGPKPSPQVRAIIQRLLDVYPRGDARSPAEGAALEVDFESCATCGGDMVVDAGRSMLRCADPECGTLRELVGTVFDDSQFYSQEGQKAKSGTFNPNRHFQFWWMHILAREPEEEIGDKNDPNNMYGELLIVGMQKIVRRDRMILRLLEVNDIRAMLRELDRTDLNKNVPLFLKKLTGVGPPQLSDSLAVRVENIFTKAIEIGERVRGPDRVNRNYYPFYILKILDHIIPEDDYENRRILYYIYVQSKETVESDDADWEPICAELSEISYKPTDRSLGLKYRPL